MSEENVYDPKEGEGVTGESLLHDLTYIAPIVKEPSLLPDILDVPDEVIQLQRKDVLVVFDDDGQSVELLVRGRKVVVHLDQEDETAVFLAPNGETGAMLSLDHAKVMRECDGGDGANVADCVFARLHLKESHGINYTPNW